MSASNFSYATIVINYLNQKEEVMRLVEKITSEEAKRMYYAHNPIKKEDEDD